MPTHALRTDAANREWFVDPRGAERRLQVTGHGDAHTVVFSIWRENACTGTFQLPVEDTPHLIAHLADCLAATMPEPRGDAHAVSRRSPVGPDRVGDAVARLRARLRRWRG